MICKYCEIETALSGLSHFNKHVKWCDFNPNKQKALDDLKSRRHNFNSKPTNQYIKAKELGLPKPEISDETRKKFSDSSRGRVVSNETKEKISLRRKKWLKENPDKHPWRRHQNYKSHPCEKLKEILKSYNLKFEEEYIPLKTRNFSCDIVFCEEKLIIEVNGQQHYDCNGNLQPYYQQRHDEILVEGWEIIELHYAKCYSKDIINHLLQNEKFSTIFKTCTSMPSLF